MDEVLVVGAGPAGSTLAALLSAQGVKAALVDRAHFPRSKPCGEALNPGAVALLGRLGHVLEGPDIRGWELQGEGWRFVGEYPARHVGRGCARSVLDSRLVRQAAQSGAQLRLGVRVEGLLWSGNRVVGVRARTARGMASMKARVVVGADGLRSVVARELGLQRTGLLKKLGLSVHLGGLELPLQRGEIHLRQGVVVGMAPIAPGQSNLTVVVPWAEAPHAREGLEPFVGRVLKSLGLGNRLAAAHRLGPVLATGPFDVPVRRATFAGALLVGDAAGYFDPLTGQGIFRALRSAQFAAQALLRVLDGHPQALLAYEHQRRRAFRSGEALQRVVERTLYRPALMRRLAPVLGPGSRWGQWLMARLGDCHEEGRRDAHGERNRAGLFHATGF